MSFFSLSRQPLSFSSLSFTSHSHRAQMRKVGRVPLPVPLRLDLAQGNARQLERVLLQNLRRRRRRDRVVEDLIKCPKAPLRRGTELAVLHAEGHRVVGARGHHVLREEGPRGGVAARDRGLGERDQVSDGLDLREPFRFLRRQLHERRRRLQRGGDDDAVKVLGDRGARAGGRGRDLDAASRPSSGDGDDFGAGAHLHGALARSRVGGDFFFHVLPQALVAAIKGQGAEAVGPWRLERVCLLF